MRSIAIAIIAFRENRRPRDKQLGPRFPTRPSRFRIHSAIHL